MLRGIHQTIVIKVHRFSCEVPVVVSRIQLILNFLDSFLKNIKFNENPSSGSRIVQADGRTDT